MCALAPWYGETLYSSGVMMGQVVRRMLLQWRRWVRAGQISFLPGWIQKKVWHKLPGTESISFGIRILPPQVHHCLVLRKWTAQIHLWRLQKPERRPLLCANQYLLSIWAVHVPKRRLSMAAKPRAVELACMVGQQSLPISQNSSHWVLCTGMDSFF